MSHTDHTTQTAHPAPHHAPHDAPPRQAAADGSQKSWTLLAVALTAQILVVLDISVVNTALPSIGSALHLQGGQLAVAGHRLPDDVRRRPAPRRSHRRPALAARGLPDRPDPVHRRRRWSAGSPTNGSELIAARAVQGLSAALLTPSALSLIMTTYAGAQRKTALAMWGAVGSLGVAVGVLLGGALTTWAGWQSIFWINGPIGVVALLVGRRVVAKDTTPRPSIRDFDLPGAATVIGGLAALIYGLGGTATHGWMSVQTVAALGRLAVLLGAFLSSSSARPSRCSRRTSGS